MDDEIAPLTEVNEEDQDEIDDYIATETHLENMPPTDRYYGAYFAVLMLSTACLLPWKMIVSVVDYFQYLYPDFRPELSFPFTYTLFTTLAIIFTIATVNHIPLFIRLLFGSIVFFFSILFLPLLDIGLHSCHVSPEVGFSLTLLACAAIGSGSGGESFICCSLWPIPQPCHKLCRAGTG